MFIYLNDVTEKQGPDQYIQGSHLSHRPVFEAGDYGFHQRVVDAPEIYSRYHKENGGPVDAQIGSLTGMKGTVVLEDTGGFHRGQPVKEGYHFFYMLEFVRSSLAFQDTTILVPICEKNLDSQLKKALKQNSRTFSRFKMSPDRCRS